MSQEVLFYVRLLNDKLKPVPGSTVIRVYALNAASLQRASQVTNTFDFTDRVGFAFESNADTWTLVPGFSQKSAATCS